jgi:hypothetical protein
LTWIELKTLLNTNEIIGIAMRACLKETKTVRSNTFELFGFDFMLDRDLNVKLIEANCNPSITEDSPLLAELIPKMLSTLETTQTTPSNSPSIESSTPKTNDSTTSNDSKKTAGIS